MTHDLTVTAYLTLLASLALLELLARRTPLPIATLDALLARFLHPRTIRLTVLFTWWWLGWHFLAAA